ncbi:MAG: BlaI/MecI/CopY family transcriptional regulator [Planctomycetota bacterium]
MARPKSDSLTARELEVMHVFWNVGPLTAAEARERLESQGRRLSYATVANLCRLLEKKGYVSRKGDARPFTFFPSKPFEEVSGHLVKDLIEKVFAGSRESLLVQLLGSKKLSKRERATLQQFLEDENGGN